MVFAIYGGHLGHVTWTIYIDFRSPFLRMLHMRSLALIGQTVSEEKIFEIVNDVVGRTPEHGHPISSPFEPSAQVS